MMKSGKILFKNTVNTEQPLFNHSQNQKIIMTSNNNNRQSEVVHKTATATITQQRNQQEHPHNSDCQFILKPLRPDKQRKVHLKTQVKLMFPKQYVPAYIQAFKNYPGKQMFGNKLDHKGSQQINFHKALWQKQVQKNRLWEIQVNDQSKYIKKNRKKSAFRPAKIIQQQIYEPIPAKKVCQICKYEFDDYLCHLQDAHHKKILKQSFGNYYIQDQVQFEAKRQKQLLLSVQFLQINEMKDILVEKKKNLKQSALRYNEKKREIVKYVHERCQNQ